jgi:hypothetical protein
MVEQAAMDFFTTVASNRGAAARPAGRRRTVVLSIVGIEESRDFGWHVATLAHERAMRQARKPRTDHGHAHAARRVGRGRAVPVEVTPAPEPSWRPFRKPS